MPSVPVIIPSYLVWLGIPAFIAGGLAGIAWLWRMLVLIGTLVARVGENVDQMTELLPVIIRMAEAFKDDAGSTLLDTIHQIQAAQLTDSELARSGVSRIEATQARLEQFFTAWNEGHRTHETRLASAEQADATVTARLGTIETQLSIMVQRMGQNELRIKNLSGGAGC